MPASPSPKPATPVTGTPRVSASPLLGAALALVPPSVTDAELEARLADAGATPRPALAADLLAALAELGLVRVSRRDGERPRYVATTLGSRAIEASVQAGAALPLEELERLRTDLLSTIAHELRTPLTSIRTSVGLLLDPASDPTPDQTRTLLEAIERNGDRMQRLVGDILDLSRFRAGSVALQLRRFGAAALAQGAAAAVEPLAVKRGQRIELVPAAGHDHQVFGDRRRLEQALINLVANAQRFSPDGAIVELRVERRGESTAWVVVDHGPGIADDDRERLFERFFVGRNDRSGPRDGVGLGLPTALAIAQAHGGTIEVESALGIGSSFAIIVPTAGPEDEP